LIFFAGECKFPGSHGKTAEVYPMKVNKGTGELWVGFKQIHPSYFEGNDFD